MDLVAKPVTIIDRPNAEIAAPLKNDIQFKGVEFHYGRGAGVIDDLTTTNFHREPLDLQHGRPSWRTNSESTTPGVVR